MTSGGASAVLDTWASANPSHKMGEELGPFQAEEEVLDTWYPRNCRGKFNSMGKHHQQPQERKKLVSLGQMPTKPGKAHETFFPLPFRP